MLYSYIDEKMAEARLDAMIQEAKEYRQAKKFSQKRTLRLPKLSNLFAVRKTEKKTAVAPQAR